MDFSLLGPVEATDDGQPLPLSGPRQRALLARLLIDANRVVSSERLVADLWEAPPHDAQGALQSQVSRLRKTLGDRVVTKQPGYFVRVEPGELDLDRFRASVAEAAAVADPGERSRMFRGADSLFRGTPLADVEAPFAETERAALEELRLAALEGRVDADLERGGHGELVGELGMYIREHPLRERLRAQLILALYRSGRQADALEAYRSAKRTLDEELGLEPSPALRELERAILTQDESLAPPAAAPAGETAVTEKSGEPQPRRRLQAPLIAVALIALSGASAAAVALTRGSTESTDAPQTQTTSPPTQTVAQPQSRAARQHRRKRVDVKRSSKPPAVHTTTAEPRRTTPATTSPSAVAARPAATLPSTRTGPTMTRPSIPTTHKPAKPATRLVAISDSFDGDVIDPTIWHLILTDSNVTLEQHDGQLVITVGTSAQRAGTYNQIDAHVGSQCQFPGDFDARVDYALLEWPPNANILIGLNGIYASAFAGRESRTQTGDIYAGWVSSSFGGVPLPDMQGSLRIVRRNGIATSYFWHDGGWLRLASGPSTGAAVLGLQASSASADSEFSRQEVKVAFDNFKVQGTNPTGECPTG